MMRGKMALCLMAALAMVVVGCDPGQPSTRPPASAPPSVPPIPGTVVVPLGNRPFHLYVPRSYAKGRPAALIVALHGYSAKASDVVPYFGLAAPAEQRGFLVAVPDGTVDQVGNEFWNATNACCNFYGSGVDDSAYLSQLIGTVKRLYTVDNARVFVMGHSNGGFMTHRMACEHADEITAIAAVSGVLWTDPKLCKPSRPISVLQIHGTADETIAYDGGSNGADRDYPGAEQTVAQWRSLDHCGTAADTTAPRADLDSAVAGAETQFIRYSCAAGIRVELWRLNGSKHVPKLTPAFGAAVVDFFFSSADAAK
jgi:polyhydroxybutyrate depolymerase